MARRKRDEKYVKIANELFANNEINNAGDLQAVLREIMGSATETMLDSELTEHLDYEKHQPRNGSNKRNGTNGKRFNLLMVKWILMSQGIATVLSSQL